MICPKCGKETTGSFCTFCGEPIKETKKIHNIIHSESIRKFLPMPARIAAIFWTVCCIFNLSQISKIGLGQYIGVTLFGFILFIGITDIVYFKKHSHLTPVLKTEKPTLTYQKIDFNKPFDQMEGHEFEYYCADILGKNDFTNVEVTKGSGDQGIDIIAYKDGVKYGIQCKCYSSDIGNKAVQEAFSGKTFYECHVAAVLTNRYFTKSAKELAEKNGVLLWDRDMLLKFNKETELSISSDQGRVATPEEAREFISPYIDQINSRYSNRHHNSSSMAMLNTKTYGCTKNKWISLLLCIFTVCGHKFYEGKVGMGVLYLLTFGLFGIGWILDIIALIKKTNPYYV